MRVKALMRRLESVAVHEYEYALGSWQYNPQKGQLYNDSFRIYLTSTENSIMQILANNQGRVVTYASLAEGIWGTDYPNSIHALRMHVSRLRHKIEIEPGYPPIISAKVGIGYYLEKS